MNRTYIVLLCVCILFVVCALLCLPALGATDGSLAARDPEGFVFLCVGVGTACAAVAALIIVFCYRMKIRKTIYPLDKYASLSLTHQEDTYTTTTVTRRKISSSNNNGNKR